MPALPLLFVALMLIEYGDRDPQRRISKEGDEMLRRLLVGSAHYILGPFGQDSDLRRHGEKIARRGAKNAKKRAAVAVARKLSLSLSLSLSLCVCSCTACGLQQRSMRSAPQHASTPRAGGGSLEGRRWSTTEHEGGEGSAIERRGDPTVADGHPRSRPR
jgi:hypothetical protein